MAANQNKMGHTTKFDSTGKYYSIGSKENFGVASNVSVDQYVNMNNFLNDQINASVIDEMSSTDIEVGIHDLSRIIPLVRSLIAPILNIPLDRHNTYGNINLCEVT